jgi:hypothetical protein
MDPLADITNDTQEILSGPDPYILSRSVLHRTVSHPGVCGPVACVRTLRLNRLDVLCELVRTVRVDEAGRDAGQ